MIGPRTLHQNNGKQKAKEKDQLLSRRRALPLRVTKSLSILIHQEIPELLVMGWVTRRDHPPSSRRLISIYNKWLFENSLYKKLRIIHNLTNSKILNITIKKNNKLILNKALIDKAEMIIQANKHNYQNSLAPNNHQPTNSRQK